MRSCGLFSILIPSAVTFVFLPSQKRVTPQNTHSSRTSTTATFTGKTSSEKTPPAVDDDCENNSYPTLKELTKIQKGELCIQHNFLDSAQIEALQLDIDQLLLHSSSSYDNLALFQASGLSNRVQGDENIFGSSDRLCCTITPDLFRGKEEFSSLRDVVKEKLEQLKIDLQHVLSSRELKLEEMYYSVSPKGSHLPRHQDERHEDTKGDKAWINETRRSVSWLIYLNRDGWGGSRRIAENTGTGGELRAYCRPCCSKENIYCGSDEGNIQVGWLRCQSSLSRKPNIEFEPIFLDSWVKTPAPEPEDKDKLNDYHHQPLKWKPMSALYRIRRDNSSNLASEQPNLEYANLNREYLSVPFGPDTPSWPSDKELDPAEFGKALGLQMTSEDHQSRFIGLEEIHSSNDQSMMNVVDVVPTGGTLVLFDSVTVPHEVLKVISGTRLAIAGWFHERQQEFPEWYGT